MTEFASYVKVRLIQRGVVTTRAESQHSMSASAGLSLKFSLVCVVNEVARSAMGSFISAWNITAVRSAPENQMFLYIIYRHVRYKLNIISKPLDSGAIDFTQTHCGCAGCVAMHLLEISMSHPEQSSAFPLPAQAVGGDGSQHLTDSRSVFPTSLPTRITTVFRMVLSSQGTALLC